MTTKRPLATPYRLYALCAFVMALFLFQGMPLISEAGGGGAGGAIQIGAVNVNLGLVDINGNFIAPAVPPPAITASGTGLATWCWSGSCTSGTDAEALAFVTYYLGLIKSEYGTLTGSTILTDAGGNVIYIACVNGGVVTVEYSNTPPPVDVCPYDAGVQTDISQCSPQCTPNGCQTSTCNTTTCFDTCTVKTGTMDCSATQTAALNAVPATIQAGNTVSLNYDCEPAAPANILPRIGTLSPWPTDKGSVSDNPSISTTYTLNCYGTYGIVSASASVNVNACVLYAGQSCSASNICGMSNSGTYNCSGTCSVSAPSDSLCPAPKPDLTPGSLSPLTATAGAVTTFTLPVNNIGTASTGGSFTSLLQRATDAAGSGATDIGTASTGAIAAGGTGPASFNYTFAVSDIGQTIYLRSCADKNAAGDPGIITELREDNNCSTSWSLVTVTAAAGPSVSCTASATNYVIGSSPPLTYTAVPANGAIAPYTWTASDGGSFGSSVSATRTFTAVGVYAMQVSASNSGAGFCPSVTVTGGVCTNTGPVTLTASPTRVQAGVPTTVTFTSNGANVGGGNCTLTGPGITTQTYVPASCTVAATYSPSLTLTGQSTYTLSCPAGQSATAIVNIVPKVREF